MSRTKRKDPSDNAKKQPDYHIIINNEIITINFSRHQKANRDKKKTYKPGKAAKAFLHKGRKAKLKQELKKTQDFDNLPAPREVKTDEWNYN